MILNHPRLTCATSRRPFNMSFVHGKTESAGANRKAFLESSGINLEDLVCARQVHGTEIKVVEASDRGRGALDHSSAFSDTDALITDKIGVPLAVFTADCLPIFLFDPVRPAVGLVHAGRRGTEKEIVKKSLWLMQKEYNVRPEDLLVGFGPAIRECCYEVGEDFSRVFSCGLKKRENSYYLDLAAINREQLSSSGVKDEHIFDEGICTSCRQNEFFSYRRLGPDCGRMMSVIMLK